MNKEMIIVLDFGGQYNQLIARRVRECNVYAEVHPYTLSLDKIKEMVDLDAVKSDLKGRKAVKLIVDNAKPVETEKEKKAAKKSAKKEDEAAEAPAEEAPKAEE